ncbi:MAG: PAS domain S-box-containing protein [Candidatus Azotimanducaceae bacterium]|jgi:PAS domain S-box-containing protein
MRADKLVVVGAELSLQHEMTQLFNTVNAPIFGTDAEANVNEWSQKLEEITGFDMKEVIGGCIVADFITDDYKALVSEVLAQALKDEQTNWEFPLFAKHGARVDLLLNAVARSSAAGQIVAVINVGQNITELNEERFKLQKERKEAAFAGMDLGAGVKSA